MTEYPVSFEIERPASMSRAHVFLRILILVLASWILGSGGGLGLVYLGLPAVAAILIAQKGGERYLTEDGDRVTGWVAFIVGVLAYVALLTDELPGGGRQPARLEIVRSGSPTVGTALLRIVKAIPSVLVLALLGIVSCARRPARRDLDPAQRALPRAPLDIPVRRHPLARAPPRLPRLTRRALPALLVRHRPRRTINRRRARGRARALDAVRGLVDMT